jgi:dipeptidyl aminopeptidase/acylaminoacyl peptidase
LALPPLIPREILFGNPEKALPLLSPDGRRLAYLAPLDGVLNVWVGAPAGTGAGDRPVTRDADRGIRQYFWGRDSGHILYLQDKGGDENWQLFSVDLAQGTERELTPYPDVQVQVVDHSKHFPHDVVLAMNRTDARRHDAYRLDLRSGEVRLVAENPGNVVQWVTDAELRVRAAVGARDDGGFDLLLRASEGAAWATALSWSAEDALTSGPVTFSRDGRALVLRDSHGANAARLVRRPLSGGDAAVLAEDPDYDVAEVLVHPDTYEVQLASFVRARRDWVVLDRALERDIAAVRSLRDGDFLLYDRTDADDRWLVGYTQDTAPASYYAFDRATGRGQFLFTTRPALERFTLAAMEPIGFRARDGLEIHGYLTRPHGVARTGLPLVVNVHGGPWHRDEWGYDPEAQWLANRGYACLQVNFRGSTGYGKRFVNAGDREWGGKMHDDVVDAVGWAIAQGVADPERIAIYGGSYGGYAALVGATFTPDLFRCAVSIVGPSNLLTFIDTIPPYWSSYRTMLYQRVGNPETEPDFLKSRSPLFHVDRIKIPLLIAQGANDPRVNRAESEQIVAAMREKGIDHEYLLFEDEGHGFAKPENRLRFYAAAERFLARHLGGRAQD